MSDDAKAHETANQQRRSERIAKRLSEDPRARARIEDQLRPCHEAYRAVVDNLNDMPGDFDTIPIVDQAMAVSDLGRWLTDARLAATIMQRSSSPQLTFTLVCTPNVQLPADRLAHLVQAFGKDQAYIPETRAGALPSAKIKAYCLIELVRQYTSAQLSGEPMKQPFQVRFSLIPSQCAELDGASAGRATRSAQLEKLRGARALTPSARVPTLLEAITLWFTLRAHGDALSDEATPDRTAITHFDLPIGKLSAGPWWKPPLLVTEWDGILASLGGSDGQARVASGASPTATRIAIG